MARQIITRARHLRKNMTDAERILWRNLKALNLPLKIRRQHPVTPYIVDFACIGKKLIIELDGGQHMQNQSYDERRTQYLQQQGWQVLRFWNNQVLHELDSVLAEIYLELGGE